MGLLHPLPPLPGPSPKYAPKDHHPPHAWFNGEACQDGAEGGQVVLDVQGLHLLQKDKGLGDTLGRGRLQGLGQKVLYVSQIQELDGEDDLVQGCAMNLRGHMIRHSE